MTGKRWSWSDAAKSRLRAQGITSRLAKAIRHTREIPKTGIAGAKGKGWRIIGPDGTEYRLKNLRKFCRTHAALFGDAAWKKPYSGLTVNGHWRGWKVVGGKEKL